MKVCMIALRHSLDDARVVHKEAASLMKEGHDVTLIMTPDMKGCYKRADGSVVAQGAGDINEVEYAGATVIGLPKKGGRINRLLMIAKYVKLVVDQNPDVIHVHEPDFALFVGKRAKKALSNKVILVHDLHEYPPGSLAERYGGGLLTWIIHKLVMFADYYLNSTVDYIFTANEIVRGYMISLLPHLDGEVLLNSPMLSMFPQRDISKQEDNGKPILIGHEGALPFNRGLKEMVKVLDHFRGKIILYIIGDVFGEEKIWLEREIAEKKLQDSIKITGWLPYSEVGTHLDKVDFGLILFENTLNNKLAGPPNKVFNYMNSGLPVLSVPLPEVRRIVEDTNCGIIFKGWKVNDIIAGIEVAISMKEKKHELSENGQTAVKNIYSWENMEKRLFRAYRNFQIK